MIQTERRKGYIFRNKFINEADFQVIKEIENIYKKYKDQNRELEFAGIPKILIPNAVRLLTGKPEYWLLPFGAAKIMPYYNVFPVAFYYYQGSKDYSFKNYKEKICESFDMEWLKARNIKYLFIPSAFGKIGECIYDFEKIKKESKIIFEVGNSRFYRLF
jgi:hypothetical protein